MGTRGTLSGAPTAAKTPTATNERRPRLDHEGGVTATYLYDPDGQPPADGQPLLTSLRGSDVRRFRAGQHWRDGAVPASPRQTSAGTGRSRDGLATEGPPEVDEGRQQAERYEGTYSRYQPHRVEEDSCSGLQAELKGYIGERLDPTNGLLSLNARWYDPKLARFLRADGLDT